MKKGKTHTTKEHAEMIGNAVIYVFKNWRSILAIYGSIAVLFGTVGTLLTTHIIIPGIKPFVRPIVKEYTSHYQAQIDSLKEEFKNCE
jgi:hypothetical protein